MLMGSTSIAASATVAVGSSQDAHKGMRLSQIPALWALAGFCAAGCVKVPPDLITPLPTYPPRVARMSVVGFDRLEWVQTGAMFVSGGGITGAGASGTMVPASDRSAVRYQLENTGCIEVVEDGSDAPIRLEGSSNAIRDIGPQHYLTVFVEALTLLPILGLPVPDHVNGWATARLYVNGRPIKSYEASSPLAFWTTVYSVRRDDDQAMNIARARAIREVITQVVSDLCGAAPLLLPPSEATGAIGK